MGHRPGQLSQRDEADGIGQGCDRPEGRRAEGRIPAAQHPGERTDDAGDVDGPAQPVVPEPRGEDPSAAGTQLGRFVAEQDVQQDVVVDENIAERRTARHARSGSDSAATRASVA